ncbi:MAG: pilus assembly protein PilP [Rhodocyclaceae bacterium]|nr:pilus assembly protein PilP [Rhodocyclaceae bacterium]
MNRQTLAAVMTAAFLAACGGEEHRDVKQWMQDAARDMQGRVQPLPEIRPFPIVSYDANDQQEPFNAAKVLPEKRAGTGAQPDFDRPKEPLEAYPLESLQMVGVVRKGGTMHALIQVGGMVHQVKAGNHLGQSFGMITAVKEAEVQIKELVQDPSGQTADWIERPATLQLQERPVEPQKEVKK